MNDRSRPPRLAMRALGLLDLAAAWIVIAAMAALAVLVVLQVVLRYVFGSSFMPADELARLCFVWAVFLAIPLGLKAKRHVMVELLTACLPDRVRLPLARLVMLASAWIMGLAGYQAVRVAIDNWDETLPTLELTAASFFVAVAVGSLHSALHLLAGAVTQDGAGAPASGMEQTP